MMKKQLVCLVLCSVLAGCIRAGDYDLFPLRKKIFNSITGYSVDYTEDESTFVSKQTQRELNYVKNKALTVKKGEALLADKIFDKTTYRTFVYKPNKKGVLTSHSYPVKLDNKMEYAVVGHVTVDSVRYALLDSGLDDFVFLFDEEGNFYNKAGRIDDGILQMVDEEIFVYPSDLKMQTIARMRDEISNVQNGYELKYDGTKLDRIWFNYMSYDGGNTSGEFERLSFPNKPGLIMVNGVGLRVLKADDDAITYMILKD